MANLGCLTMNDEKSVGKGLIAMFIELRSQKHFLVEIAILLN